MQRPGPAAVVIVTTVGLAGLALLAVGGLDVKSLRRAALWLFALVLLDGCASTEMIERQRYQGATLARPDRIIVHDFTANPADVPPEPAFAAQTAGGLKPTPPQVEIRRSEVIGSDTLEGAANRTADEIAAQLR